MNEPLFPPLRIKGKTIPVPIIQGGMGIGVSLHELARAVAMEGGVGVLSSASLDRIVSKRQGRKVDTYAAVREEVQLSLCGSGAIGINIMVALQRDYRDTVAASIDAGVDMIISGGGLPLDLPSLHPAGDTALVPIVSSARALEIICKKWERFGYRPDAVVLEGPLAGGHQGFKMDQIPQEQHSLENLFPSVKDMAKKYGDFPVIVAGGIYTRNDILRFLALGADGVQMGTRFLATVESNASPEYKKAVIDSTEDDIVVVDRPGSPCGMPFRIIRQSPMFQSALLQLRKPRCDKGYVLARDRNGKLTVCSAKESNDRAFCICNGLLSSGGYNTNEEEQLFTVGAKAHLVDRIMTVKELMDELKGIAPA